MQLDNELIGVVDNVQIGDVLANKVGFKDVQNPTDVTPFHLKQTNTSRAWHAHKSH